MRIRVEGTEAGAPPLSNVSPPCWSPGSQPLLRQLRGEHRGPHVPDHRHPADHARGTRRRRARRPVMPAAGLEPEGDPTICTLYDEFAGVAGVPRARQRSQG